MSKRYFSEWEGKPLDEIFTLARELAEDPTYPTVKAWRDDGGRVLGHFQVYFRYSFIRRRHSCAR